MKQQKKPSKWSCMPVALAMVLDLEVQEIFDFLGHDGGEIWYPNEEDPMRRRGFHSQELVDFALSRGYAVTEIHSKPVFEESWGGEPGIRQINKDEKDLERIETNIENSCGIIYCQRHRNARYRHTLAYDHGKIYDPDLNGGEIDFPKDGVLYALWRVDKIC